MSSALAGIRVLDLTNVLAGPFCAYQLALLGADVVKIEVPDGGDLARQLGADPALNARQMGASFLAQNAGKKSVTLNLKKAEGKAVLKRLVGSADVLVENFRPGVMARLGLAYEDLAATNPRLVYCAISGFGQEGPMKTAPAYDQIIQGLSGMMSVTGTPESAPLRSGYPVADTLAGMTAAFAISSALVRRNASGEGAFIDVSMLDSALTAMGWAVSNYLIAGVEPRPHGNDNFTAAPSGAFRAKDGLINIAANKQEQFEALVEAVGRPELATDPRFAERESRKQHRGALTLELEAALGNRSCAEWQSVFNKIGVPAGCVLTVPQALSLPQVAQRELLKTFDNVPGIDRAVTVARSGFKLSGGDPDVAAPPPELGCHTDDVLAGAGYSGAEIAALREAGIV
ncbi:MAG TPA: CaiB/BaiF CoA-transferase family protein [Caldimonas sp.]|nr:CaiB/BaiF CoA-transferase family protein [Caldimonas sp.]